MQWSGRFRAASAASALFLTCAVAQAQPNDARRLLEEGAAAYQNGDFASAERAFEQSFALKPTYDTASNLGSAESKLGKHREAAEHFEYALRNLPTSESPDKGERLARLLAESKAKVVTLRLEVNVVGAEVILNGNSVGKAPIDHEIFGDAGTLLVVANAPKHERFEKTENFGAGTSHTISIVMTRTAGAEEPEGRPSWPGWLMGSVGLAAAGVGGALVGVGQAKLSDAEDRGAALASAGGACTDGESQTSPECVEGRAALNDAGTLSGAGIGLLATGGALLIAGVVYLALPSNDEAKPEISLVPALTNDFQGIFVLGTF